jgi:muramoyltetrapeptide carboxypeptidase
LTTTPPPLAAGDRVGVVAPSGPVDAGRLAVGVDILRSWGLEPVVGRSVRTRSGYLAGSDAARAEDFSSAWRDPSVRAVFAARGGYGAARILDLVDWDVLRTAAPKHFVGSSDTTALHEAIAVELGVATVFGPMVASQVFVGDEPTRAHLRTLLFDPPPSIAFPESAAVVPGRASGRTVGGTVALVAAGVGTRHSRPARDGIAVLEDVGEPPYRLDRDLTQLLRAGWFEGVRGIVLGTFVDCGPPGAALDVLVERLLPLDVPLLAGALVGHGPRTLSVPLGVAATLDTATASLALGRDDPALA